MKTDALEAPALHTTPSPSRLERLVFFYRALGDGTRMKILWLLMGGELCVGDLARSVEMTESAVSRQLRELRAVKLVKSRRSKRNIYYSVNGADTRAVLEQTLDHIEQDSHGRRTCI